MPATMTNTTAAVLINDAALDMLDPFKELFPLGLKLRDAGIDAWRDVFFEADLYRTERAAGTSKRDASRRAVDGLRAIAARLAA